MQGEREDQPLIRPMESALMGKICFLTMVGIAICAWCVLDTWNHDVSSELFGIAEVKNQRIDLMTGQISADVTHPFNYPLTLALFQFIFMGIVFLVFWYLLSREPARDFAVLKES